MKDLYSKLKVVKVYAPILVVDSTVPVAAEVDLKGFNSAVIEISNAAKPVGDTGTITIALSHADDDGTGASGSYSDCTINDVNVPTTVTTITSGVIFTLATALQAADVALVGYVGGKRFIKLTTAEANSNSTGTIIGVNVIKGDAENPLV
jgi:hypothetical protein